MTSANQTPRIITINTPGPRGIQGPPGFASSGSNTYLGDQIITGSILISGSIVPNIGVGSTTSSFSLGSETAAWKDIYVSEGSIKFIKSGSSTVTLSAANGGISVDGGSVISADGVSGQFITSKSLDTNITVKDSNNSLLMGPIDIETNKEIIVEEGSDLTIFGDIDNTTPDNLSIRTLNVDSSTTLNGRLTVSNDIDTSGKINSLFYTNTKDINSDVVINNNESALMIGDTVDIEEDKELFIEDGSDLTIFGDIEIQNVATADTALFAYSASYTDTSSYAITASYALNAISTSTFPYSGSAVITGSLTVNNGTNNIVNTSNYQLLDSNGATSIDWESKTLKNGNTISTDWSNRLLQDSSEIQSIDWENRKASDSSEIKAIDWASRLLTDGTAGYITSVDWENRTLINSSGSTAIDYSNSASLLLTAGGSTLDLAKHSTLTSDGAGSLTIQSPTTTISGSILLTNPTGIFNFNSASSIITGSTPALSNTAVAFAQNGANFYIYVYIGGQWRSASLS
jgi:hypothetical protein